jgi:hypothetical protein
MSSTDHGGGKRRDEVILPGSCQRQAGPSGAYLPALPINHFAAPVFACDDEAGEKAAAETKRAECHDDDELQWFAHRNSSGSLAMFAAIRRASSLLILHVEESEP